MMLHSQSKASISSPLTVLHEPNALLEEYTVVFQSLLMFSL